MDHGFRWNSRNVPKSYIRNTECSKSSVNCDSFSEIVFSQAYENLENVLNVNGHLLTGYAGACVWGWGFSFRKWFSSEELNPVCLWFKNNSQESEYRNQTDPFYKHYTVTALLLFLCMVVIQLLLVPRWERLRDHDGSRAWWQPYTAVCVGQSNVHSVYA